jgi:hypothetical protein
MALRRILGAGFAGVLVVASAVAQGNSELFVDAPSNAASRYAPKTTKLKKDATTAEMRVVKVELALLADADKPLTLSMAGAKLTAMGSITSRTGESYVWSGKVAGEPLSSVILVVRGEQVSGEVRSRAGHFRVSPLTGGDHALIKIDERRLLPDHDQPGEPPSAQKGSKTGAATTKAARSYAAVTPVLPPPRTYTLNVLVAYTAKAEARLADIEQDIDVAAEQANISYVRSEVSIRLKVAKKYKTNLKETGNAARDIDIQEVLDKRRQYGADIAVLVVSGLHKERELENGKKQRKSICGRSRKIGAKLAEAFALVEASCLVNNASMTHEIGHLIGARHNWEQDHNKDDMGPCRESGHGLYNIAGRWGTIMAYPCPPEVCGRKLIWSNPKLKNDDGIPLGDPEYADNASCLNRQVQVFCRGSAPCAKAGAGE